MISIFSYETLFQEYMDFLCMQVFCFSEMKWLCWNKSCYNFIDDDIQTQPNALMACEAIDSHLVAIETQEEQLFLESIIDSIQGIIVFCYIRMLF